MSLHSRFNQLKSRVGEFKDKFAERQKRHDILDEDDQTVLKFLLDFTNLFLYQLCYRLKTKKNPPIFLSVDFVCSCKDTNEAHRL